MSLYSIMNTLINAGDFDMLVEFRVSNFKSIKTEQVLQFTKAQGAEFPNHFFTFTNEKESFDLLHVIALYGANASGKSNVLDALWLMKSIISDPQAISQLTPFLLSDETEDAPTEFEITFIANQIRYQYGFSATKHQVMTEYLYQFPKGRLQVLFERLPASADTSKFTFGTALKGRKNAWKDLTSTKQLFLTTAIQYNGIALEPIENFFKKTLCFIGTGISPKHTLRFAQEDQNKVNILNFLKEADLGINGLHIKEELFDEKRIPSFFPPEVKEQICKHFQGVQGGARLTAITQHLHDNQKLIDFQLSDESLGTQRFFKLAGPWLSALQEGHILVLDELNISLHPKLVQFLIQLFYNPKINTKQAQLLFTTHDPSLLNQDLFRRDQVWFCEKEDRQTQLFPLSDFSIRKESTNIERDYLSGRFGAVPFLHFDQGE